MINDREIKLTLVVSDELPSFGCYVCSDNDETKTIVLSLKNIAGLAKLDAVDFDKLVQETLAHELLHAIQDAYGQMFSESQIHRALSEPGAMIVCEDELQAQEVSANREQVFMWAVDSLRELAAAAGVEIPQHLTDRGVKDRLNEVTKATGAKDTSDEL